MLQNKMENSAQELEYLMSLLESLKELENSSQSINKKSRNRGRDEIDMSQMIRVGPNLIHRDIYKMYGNPTVREIKTELQKRHWEFDEDRDGNIHLVFRNDYYITNKMTEAELQELLLDIKMSI